MKYVGRNIYFHISTLPELNKGLLADVELAKSIASKTDLVFNVLKVSERHSVSFLYYPDFFDIPFPPLKHFFSVNLKTGKTRAIEYSSQTNPPILHRKELLLSQGHPCQVEYSMLTAVAEAEGLFSDTRRIGYKHYWDALLNEKGLRLEGHTLVSDGDIPLVERHRTALTRYQLSLPSQMLLEHDYFNSGYSFFDYGCGKGSDIRLAGGLGVTSCGWDPHYSPGSPITMADIVNLGYVINVIENPEERAQTLTNAGSLAKKLLVVSAMIDTGKDKWARRFGDGGLTSRNTFQKYFSQDELRNYIESVLGQRALAVRPGIFFVFFDADEEQQFLEKRQRRRRRSSVAAQPRVDKDALLEKHGNDLNRLWSECLEYGRLPRQEELSDFSGLFSEIGNYRKTVGFLKSIKDQTELEAAAESRKNDLRVYLALNEFYARKSPKVLSPRLVTDIKMFFGTRKAASESGQGLLYQIADADIISAACTETADKGIGYLEERKGLWLHSSNIEQLSPLLRVYVGAGIEMYGGVESFDLIKIHIESSKLTLMVCDDFLGSPLPRILERIKINLRSQHIDFFDYGDEYTPPYIYFKSRYLGEDQFNFQAQCEFDSELTCLGIAEYGTYGPKPEFFDELLDTQGLTIEGFSLELANEFPELDDPCGRYYTFRDFIECSETQARTGIPNIPSERETYEALAKLARTVLDPVIDYFGSIELTYGFSCPELSKVIKKGIAPKLDQHASHELNRSGNLICPRLGAAVDFFIRDENMLEVAQWIIENTAFDRLYYYGNDRPLHVSVGPDNKKEIVCIEEKPTSLGDVRRVPKTMSTENFKLTSF